MLRRRSKTTAAATALAPVAEPAYSDGWEVPARFNFTRDVVEPLGRQYSRLALTFVDAEGIVDRRTFREIAGDGARWAHLMRTRLDRGDRVMFVMGRVPAWHGAMLGALKGGLIAVPCSDTLHARDLAGRARDSGARLVIADRSCEVEIEEMREQVDASIAVLYLDEARAELSNYLGNAPTEDTAASEPALLLYTSGTAGEPRAVVHTHAYTWAAGSQAEHWLDVREDDVVWSTAETGGGMSIWNVLLGPWTHGSEIVLHQGGFDPEDRLELLERLGVTVLCQTPGEYRELALLDSLATTRLPRLRHAVSSGGPLDPHVIQRFQDTLGLTVHDGYGQTETSLLAANAPGMEIRPGSMGLPAPGHDVAVIDERGEVCEPGGEGDIALYGRPPTLFAGYWEDREATQTAFRDGWYVTGDRGVVDEDGYLWFVGRAEDVIVSSTYRIGPFEVESALLEHRAVAGSAVVGAPDAEKGETVKAFVVLRPGHDPTAELLSELQEHVKAVTAPYKYPREIAFVEELPKTPNGKIRRSELRRQPQTGFPEPLSLVIPLPVDETERERAEDEAAAEARRESREAARRAAAAAVRRAAERAAVRNAEAAARLHDEASRRAALELAHDEEAEPPVEAVAAAHLLVDGAAPQEAVVDLQAAEAAAVREAEETARREAEETARREAEAAAQREAGEAARRDADDAARLAAEAAALREAEEAARLAAEAAALREAEAAAQREAEEAARLAAEAARQEAEEAARREAEATAQREAEEAARREAEEAARREAEALALREAEEAARREAEAAALREAEEAARREAEAAAQREAEEAARREAEAAAQREAEEAARREAEAAAQREAEEAARREAEEAARREAEAAAQREAEEAARREAEEAVRREAEALALREAEEAARREAEEAARREAEAAAQREAEEAARREAEAAAQREAEEAARREAEAAAQREAEAAAQREAEAAAQREADEAARREAEAAAQREAEEAARREAEAAARREAEAAARREAEEAARREAEAEEAARREAEAAAVLEAEEAARREAEVAPVDDGEESLSRRERRAAEKRRKEEEQLRANEEKEQRKRDEEAAKERAKAEAEQQKRNEAAAKERAKAEAEQRKRDEAAAKERAKAEAEQQKRDEAAAKERAKAEAEQRKRDEAAAREAEKEQAKEERRRQREQAKGRGLGLGRLLSRADEEDEEDEDDTPVAPIEGIVERLQPYSRPRGRPAPVSSAPQGQDSTVEDAEASD